MAVEKKVLLIGYGNPGRLDDGLGPLLAEKIQSINIPNLTVDSDYQLIVDDAVDISKNDIVIFADAATCGREPFYFEKVQPVPNLSFSSHSVSPQALIALSKDLFDAKTDAYILGIRGYDFNDYCEKLSSKAQSNLDEALKFIIDVIKNQLFDESVIL